MLILTRKPGEKIAIGHDIVVTVLEIKGAKVSVGIEAPRDVGVHRQEIFEKIRHENLAASRIEGSDLEKAAFLFQPVVPGGEKIGD